MVLSMVTRTEWLDAGLELLADEGAPAVTIERLTGKLGVTKGSYYHHFKGAAGYRTALLEYFEAQFTTRLIDTVERSPKPSRRRSCGASSDSCCLTPTARGSRSPYGRGPCRIPKSGLRRSGWTRRERRT